MDRGTPGSPYHWSNSRDSLGRIIQIRLFSWSFLTIRLAASFFLFVFLHPMPDEFQFTSRDEKKMYVEQMFGEIARRYDFFNHFLSLGFDFAWRRRAIQILRNRLPNSNAPKILDIACGTGDL